MRSWHKLLVTAVALPLLAVASYVAYLAATYIDETVTSGSAYGFEIGTTKQDALSSSVRLSGYPNAVIYVSYGPRAGDNFSIAPSAAQLDELESHHEWEVLLDDDGNFFNTIRLTFGDGRLVEIHRHRKHFELP